jgi:hypothetical protein
VQHAIPFVSSDTRSRSGGDRQSKAAKVGSLERERCVVEMAVRGMKFTRIAERLGASPNRRSAPPGVVRWTGALGRPCDHRTGTWACFPFAKKYADGFWRIDGDPIPLIFSLKATKP